MHPPSRAEVFVLWFVLWESSEQEAAVLARAAAILGRAGIAYFPYGGWTPAYSVEPSNGERAARLLTDDPLTRPHVPPLTEHCARTGFYQAQKAWLRLDRRQPPIETVWKAMKRIHELLTSETICCEWGSDADDWVLEVLPQEEARVRAMLKADPLVAPLLRENQGSTKGILPFPPVRESDAK